MKENDQGIGQGNEMEDEKDLHRSGLDRSLADCEGASEHEVGDDGCAAWDVLAEEVRGYYEAVEHMHGLLREWKTRAAMPAVLMMMCPGEI